MAHKIIQNIPFGTAHWQVFEPNRIVSLAASTNLDVTNVVAIRPSATLTYQIGGAGVTATVQAGHILYINPKVKLIRNANAVTAVVIEVMDV